MEEATTIEGLEARLAEMERELAALRAQVAETEALRAQVAETEAGWGPTEPAMRGERTHRRRMVGMVAATVGAAAAVTVGVSTALLGWPLGLVAALVIGGSMVLAVAGLLTTHHFLRVRFSEGQNDIAGFLFTTMGVLYAVVLAFVVFAVWEQFARGEQAVTAEAAALISVFRDTQNLPAPYRQEAQDALRRYAHEVPTVEWASHGTLGPHRTPDPLNPVWAVYRKVGQTGAIGAVQYADVLTQLHALELQRHLRHLSGEASLPDVFWWILILGGVGTVAFTYVFQMANLRLHAGMTALLAGALASILFLILALDHPFTGQVHVSKYPFQHALLQFKALNNSYTVLP